MWTNIVFGYSLSKHTLLIQDKSESRGFTCRPVGPSLKVAIRAARKRAFTNIRLWPLEGAAILGFLLLVCGRDTNRHHSCATSLGYVRIFISTDQSIYIGKQFFCK